MRKSLSLLLAIAMVFSMFSSLAFAADEPVLTTQQKYDALAAKGIFTGIDGKAELDQNMTRAQFARIAALIQGLEGIGNPDTKVVTEKPFSDVELGTWYVEEIAAVKESPNKLFEGNTDGTFGPSADISVQQLAVVAAKILGLDAVEDAEVEGAAPWAAGFIQALINNNVAFPVNYADAATRGDLASIAYTADAQLNPTVPAKVSVTSASATGVKLVTVVLDKAVDTEKAKLELKFGTAVVGLDKTTWSEDKKSAVLTLKDQKIKEGNYTVTLSGLAAEEVASTTATFTGEKETVKKIEFVTASDEIAKSAQAKIKVRSENQYGELASYTVSSYTVNTGTITNTKKIDDEGYLIITVDTSALSTGLSVVPVYVYFNETSVIANKTFKVGASAFVSKMELGEVVYSDVSKSLIKAGNTVTIPVNLYDQYGNPVTPNQEAADALIINWSNYTTPFSDAFVATYLNADDVYKVRVSVKADKKIEKTGTYQINIFAGAATSSASFEVKSEKVAKKVTIGDPSKTIAAGDTSAIIPISVTDESGTELTPTEIVDNKAMISVTGGDLILYGKDKGKVKISTIPTSKNSYFSLNVMITSTIGEAPGYATKNFQAGETRVPSSLVVDKAPAAKAVLGASSEFKVLVKDQYGEAFTEDEGATLLDAYTVVATVTGATYAVANGKDINGPNDLNLGTPSITYTYDGGTSFKMLNKGFDFVTAPGTVGEASVQFDLKKATDVLQTKTVRIQTIAEDSKLTYTLDDIGDLYAAFDNRGTYLETTPVDQTLAASSKVSKKVKIVVKDASGDTVAFPDRVTDVVSSNLSVAHAGISGTVAGADAKGFVLGNKAGTASVTVYVDAADGTRKALTTAVTVKADVVTVASISVKDEVTLGTAIGTAATVTGIHVVTEVKTKDQYGVELEKADVLAYDKLLGVRFVVSDIQVRTAGTTTAQAVTIVANDINVGSEVEEFTLTAVSRDGLVTGATLFKR